MRDAKGSKLFNILSDYFDLDDCYTYNLLRSKRAFELGTMTLDDFEQWDEENILDLTNYIMEHL